MGDLIFITNSTDLPVTFPSVADFEEGWRQQQEDDLRKQRLAASGAALPRQITDTIKELLEDTGALPEPTMDPSEICDICGRLYRYKTRGMAKLQVTKHRRKEHPEAVIVG